MTNIVVSDSLTSDLILTNVLAQAGRAAENVDFSKAERGKRPSLTSALSNPFTKSVVDLFGRSLIFVEHILQKHSQNDLVLTAAVLARAEAYSEMNFGQPTDNPYQQIRRGKAVMIAMDDAISGRLGAEVPAPLRNCDRSDRFHIGGMITDLKLMLQHTATDQWLDSQAESYTPQQPKSDLMAELAAAAGPVPMTVPGNTPRT